MPTTMPSTCISPPAKTSPMKILYLEATQDTPKVMLNKREGIFEFSGRSILEDTETFYHSVMEWLAQYAQDPNPTTLFSFKLKYFNSSTSKIIYNIFDILKDIPGAQVEWCYHKDDDDILEAGQEFEEELEMKFQFKEI
jgi:hypothetical protein